MKDIKVLIVEDEIKISDIVRAYLEKNGFNVTALMLYRFSIN